MINDVVFVNEKFLKLLKNGQREFVFLTVSVSPSSTCCNLFTIGSCNCASRISSLVKSHNMSYICITAISTVSTVMRDNAFALEFSLPSLYTISKSNSFSCIIHLQIFALGFVKDFKYVNGLGFVINSNFFSYMYHRH